MPSPWEILTAPALLAQVRAWALTSIPPYPATSAQLRACAADVAPVAPADWRVTSYPEGLHILTASCLVVWAWFGPEGPDLKVYGLALLLGDDQVALDYFPPGYTFGPSAPKLSWPLQLFLLDGGANA